MIKRQPVRRSRNRSLNRKNNLDSTLVHPAVFYDAEASHRRELFNGVNERIRIERDREISLMERTVKSQVRVSECRILVESFCYIHLSV